MWREDIERMDPNIRFWRTEIRVQGSEERGRIDEGKSFVGKVRTGRKMEGRGCSIYSGERRKHNRS